ncbi:uncharacterized protein T551_01998 [Pneumocystis jirovecii RU7]|nr:uncharacterized protein T551_01998 [Pneumocystis jirovecii RU7]KTW30054.1 hypothetical protein T551_01998 [Pneumocystis jirovecii RU7]
MGNYMEAFIEGSTLWDNIEGRTLKLEHPRLDSLSERISDKDGGMYVPQRLYSVHSCGGRSHTSSSCSSEAWGDEPLGRPWALDDELSMECIWKRACETPLHSKNVFSQWTNGSDELQWFSTCTPGAQAASVHGENTSMSFTSSSFPNMYCKTRNFCSFCKHSSQYMDQQIGTGLQINSGPQVHKHASSNIGYINSDMHNDAVDTVLDVCNAHSKKSSDSSIKTGLYKTELCKNWEESGECRYGLKCQFAHGHSELRTLLRHPKYKTSPCKTFMESGSCPYGQRCCFSHTKEQIKPKKISVSLPLKNTVPSQGSTFPPSISDVTNQEKSGIKTLNTTSLSQKTMHNLDLSGFSHLFSTINLLDEISPLSLT